MYFKKNQTYNTTTQMRTEKLYNSKFNFMYLRQTYIFNKWQYFQKYDKLYEYIIIVLIFIIKQEKYKENI